MSDTDGDKEPVKSKATQGIKACGLWLCIVDIQCTQQSGRKRPHVKIGAGSKNPAVRVHDNNYV